MLTCLINSQFGVPLEAMELILIGYSFLRKDYEDTLGHVTPYMIYLDHDNADVVLAVRGLNLAKESDYAILLDNKLGKTKFGGGYVHNGLLKAAVM